MIRDERQTEADFHDHLYSDEAEHVERSALIRVVRRRIVRELVARGGLGSSSAVLSLGCGDGAIEAMLAPLVGRVVGTDVSAVAVERARATARAAGIGNVEFVAHDLSAQVLPWEDAKFDAVCLFGVLHHIPDPAIPAVLREAHRVVVPGGTVYSMDPSARRLVALFKPLVRRLYRRFHSPDERELDEIALQRAYREAGFSRSPPPTSFSFP
jgi:SAM-dependent methyltransferase